MRVDLGGASPVGMIWRAAAAVELGICDVVVGAVVRRPAPPPPVPLPPETAKLWVPSGARVTLGGVMASPGPTVMVAVAVFPSESVTVTTSVVAPAGPAT